MTLWTSRQNLLVLVPFEVHHELTITLRKSLYTLCISNFSTPNLLHGHLPKLGHYERGKIRFLYGYVLLREREGRAAWGVWLQVCPTPDCRRAPVLLMSRPVLPGRVHVGPVNHKERFAAWGSWEPKAVTLSPSGCRGGSHGCYGRPLMSMMKLTL